MSLWDAYNPRLELLRRNILSGPTNWQPDRLIFRDWWHWIDHEIAFAHGRLALTGQNAGGKSSLLSLTIPMLLDGDTSPLRLDPAQSRDRFLHWYLLGDDDADSGQPDAFRYEARTGYIALEFRQGETGNYLTIGMGVSAARNHPRKIKEWWGFIVPERRLGRNFDVRDAQGHCLGPRDFSKLTATFAVNAIVTSERGEYRRQVNNHLFGMSEADYQALIGMLIQARRPKLGEQAGPEKVCELLRDSLPGIPLDRLDRVAEVVDNIEQYQRNLADITRRAGDVEELDHRLLDLALALQQDAVYQYDRVVGQYGNVMKALGQARTQESEAEQRLADLSAQAATRHTRLAEIETRMAVFRERDDVDLPQRLGVAREHEQRQRVLLADNARRIDSQRSEIRRAEQRVGEYADRFRTSARSLAQQVERLADTARAADWHEGATELTRSASDLDTLAITDAPSEVEAVRPNPNLLPEVNRLSAAYRELAERREKLTAEENALRSVQERVSQLRSQHQARRDDEARAEDAVDDRRTELIEELVNWQEDATALGVSDAALAEVVEQVRALSEPPARGQGSFIEPLRRRAEERWRELSEAQADLVIEIARAELRMRQTAQQMEELDRDGLSPDRSDVRAAARAACNQPPLFRWVRFRPGVPADVADRVEAAACEAGLLDLLLLDGETDGTVTRGLGPLDAWVLSRPLNGVRTLAEVLEPEPGAPARVAQVLASVGWGRDSGEVWIAPDGNWQNGVARGQVAPWLSEPSGLVGAERRAAAIQRRRERLEEVRQSVDAELATLRTKQDEAVGLARQVGSELDALAGLSWQRLFQALTGLALSRGEAAAAEARLAAALPELEEAFVRHRSLEEGYGRALADLPPARGLSADGIRGRADNLARLAEQLQEYRHYGDLATLMRDHRDAVARQGREAELLREIEAAGVSTREEIGRIAAEISALEARVSDPGIAAIQQEIEGLAAEQRQLRQEEAASGELIGRANGNLYASRQTIAQQEPQEAELRAERDLRFERLRQRLTLHPTLAEYLTLLERESPVTAVRRLPRVAAPTELETEINRRRAAVQEFLHRSRDTLADYRPTPDAAWEAVTFQEDRQRLSATELLAHLSQQMEEYRRLIDEHEQELYQRIIFEHILDELRKLIRQARDFTSKTNRQLKELELSSGERLSLRFHASEGADGATIGSELEAMDQGAEWLSDERRQVLLGLIRKEVERVREEAKVRGNAMSYNDAIRRALDYRNWYEYQLLSTTPGSSGSVAVKTRGFGRRSTSAKAWALAVPVIAGVAARYDASPRADAPRLIALDEAFAGFDPNNQANYLKFLGDLKLSWLITCPDELPYSAALSAAMAYRMALADNIHTAYPILWDGKRATEPLTAEWEVTSTGESGEHD